MTQEKPQPSKSGGIFRIIRTAVLIVAVILAGLTAWAWLSSGEGAKLPFDYEGFD